MRACWWENERVKLLSKIEENPFFQTVRGGLVVGLYNQKEIWPIFGYEGESYSKGGYMPAASTTSNGCDDARRLTGRSGTLHSIQRLWEETMAAHYDLNDDSVVVIIGSGAGGGTLGNELAQKGIDVVILEAGPRIEHEDFINDEWEVFRQLAWLDNRTTSAPGASPRIFRTCRPGSSRPWAALPPIGPARRCASRSMSSRRSPTTARSTAPTCWIGRIALADLEPYYAKAEDRMGVTRTNNIEGLPGNNNFKVFKAGADKLGYKECHTGNMAINSADRDDRMGCQQTGFCFQGCKWGAKWSTLYTEIPKGEATGKLEVRPDPCCQDRARRQRQGHQRGLCRQGR